MNYYECLPLRRGGLRGMRRIPYHPRMKDLYDPGREDAGVGEGVGLGVVWTW